MAAVILNDIGPVIEAEGLMKIRDDLNTTRLPRDMKEAAALLEQRQGADFPALSEDDWAAMSTDSSCPMSIRQLPSNCYRSISRSRCRISGRTMRTSNNYR
jgi:hypothetical protein